MDRLRVCEWGGGGRAVFPHNSQCRKRKIKSLPKRPPPSNHHYHHHKWAQRNSSLRLIWGPMLMKLVINSSLCCRFLYCMCNQMWPSLGFTAINELRECARGSKRPAAGLGSDSARPGAGHSAASDSLTGVSRALGPGVPTRPRAVPVCTATLRPKAPAPVRRDRWLSRSQESRLSGGPGLGGG